jgi:hypothetical protein
MNRFHNKLRVMTISLLWLALSLYTNAQQQKTWQWVKQLGSNSWDISAGVACDSKNNLYIAGSYFDTLICGSKKVESSGNRDIFIAMYNENGVLKNIASAGGRGVDLATCLCITGDDNLVIGGRLSDTAYFGKIKVQSSDQQLFVAEIDNNGRFNWISTIAIKGDASLNMIGTDKLGNIIVSGSFDGALKTTNQEVTSKGKKDIFLARFGETGKVINLVSFGSINDDLPSSLSVDALGNVILTGIFKDSFAINRQKFSPGPAGTKSNIFITKLDINFDPIWTNFIYGDDYAQISSVKHENSGNFYLVGSFNSNIQLEDTLLSSTGYTDGFIIKYTHDGYLDWVRSFGSWYYDYAANVNIDNLGGVIVTGSIGDTLTVDSLVIEPSSKDNSALIIQYSSSGKAIWADCISGTGRNFSDGSVLDKQGNLYFTGSFRNRFEKGSDALVSFGDQDVFLAKYFNCKTTKAEIFGQTFFCPGSSTELSIQRGFSNIVWNDTILDKHSIIAEIPGHYWVKMLDKKGCLMTDTVQIIQNDLPVFTLGNDTSVFLTDSILLQVRDKYAQYLWHDYSQEPTFLAKSVDQKPGTFEYWLKVTDSLSCNYSDTISVTYLTGMVDLMKAQLVTYPNPATDKIFWYLNTEDHSRLMIELTDVNGRLLYHQDLKNYNPREINEINLNGLPTGQYNLKIRNPYSSDNFKTARIIKQ